MHDYKEMITLPGWDSIGDDMLGAANANNVRAPGYGSIRVDG